MSDIFELADLPTLESERLLLRKIEPEDIDSIFRYTNNPVFFETMGRPTPFSPEDTRQWIESFMNKPWLWCIVLKHENKIIGDCGFCQLHPRAARGEISYAIDPAYWNNGYAREAASRVVRFGFETLNLNRIQGICNTKNLGSERVLQKIGMQYEGTLRHYIQHEGIPLDMRMYATLKDEWK